MHEALFLIASPIYLGLLFIDIKQSFSLISLLLVLNLFIFTFKHRLTTYVFLRINLKDEDKILKKKRGESEFRRKR